MFAGRVGGWGVEEETSVSQIRLPWRGPRATAHAEHVRRSWWILACSPRFPSFWWAFLPFLTGRRWRNSFHAALGVWSDEAPSIRRTRWWRSWGTRKRFDFFSFFFPCWIFKTVNLASERSRQRKARVRQDSPPECNYSARDDRMRDWYPQRQSLQSSRNQGTFDRLPNFFSADKAPWLHLFRFQAVEV